VSNSPEISGGSFSSPAGLQNLHGTPGPHLQPFGPSRQARIGWFSQTHPALSQTSHFGRNEKGAELALITLYFSSDMPPRHPRTYHSPKPAPFDYRPIIAVVAIVILSLAAIAFVFSLRAQ
jgi:hypothetical protein